MTMMMMTTDDDDERGGINTKLEKAMTIGGLIIGAVIVCILIYFVASGSRDRRRLRQQRTGYQNPAGNYR